MTIEKAMTILLRLQKSHGDIEVVFDCPHCLRVIRPLTIEIGPPMAILKGERVE